MAKQTIKEHILQYQIHGLLDFYQILHFETDVMDALKFFGNKDVKRFGYIAHHKKLGYLVGQPDIVVIYNKKVFFIELKRIGGRQSPEQKAVEKKIKEQGFEYEIWRTLDDCHNFIKKNAK